VIGFEVDIMDGVARRLGVTARFHHCSWSNLVPSLERGDLPCSKTPRSSA